MIEISKKINDQLTKWIGIPVSGMLALHLSGFLDYATQSFISLLVDYVCFMGISATLWYGNVLVHYSLRPHLYRITKIYIRIPVRYGVTVVFSWIISFVLLTLWNMAIHHGTFPYRTIFFSQLIMTFISFQVSLFYEIVYLNKERESDLVKVERSEKLKVQAQLEELKSQVSPHFLFNTLNTLSLLIARSPEKARLFNDTLANVYRYILLNKEKNLVPLQEEIESAKNYFYLVKIRYLEGVHLHISSNGIDTGNYLVPPLSLQALVENAIKHNQFSGHQPLTIWIDIRDHAILVTNNINLKKFDVPSSGTGLVNLDKRYLLVVNRHIIITRDEKMFKVELPILKW